MARAGRGAWRRCHPPLRASKACAALQRRRATVSAAVFPQPSFPARVGIALANVAAADFLLYGQPWGLSLTVLLAVVGARVLAARPAVFARSGWPGTLALLV